MAYIINSTNGSVITTVADGTIDQQATSITLVGQNYAGYGEFINENFVKLLENFSSNTAPAAPLAGQLWWDTTTGVLKAYTGIAWKNIPSTHMGSSQPVQFTFGDLWWDTTSNQLKVCDQGGIFRPAGGSLTLSGDITGTGSGAVTTALSATGVTAGNYGTASSTPTLAIDAKGRITSAANTSINITSSQVSNFAATTRTSVSANSGLTYNSTTGVFGVDTTVIPSAASGGSALVGYTAGGTGAVTTTVQAKLREHVCASDFGAVGDGSDETTKLQNALNAATGKTLLLENGKTYHYTALSIHADTTMISNGAILSRVAPSTSHGIAIAAGVYIDKLVINTPGGPTGDKGVLISGDNVSIDFLSITAAAQGAYNSANFAVEIESTSPGTQLSNITVRDFYCKYFSAGMFIKNVRNMLVQSAMVEYFRTGFYLRDVARSQFSNVTCRYTASTSYGVNGENGLLLESTLASASCFDLQFNAWTVVGAGEHSYRLGGSLQIRDVWFNNCRSWGSGSAILVNNPAATEWHGGCGFKVLGGGELHRNIYFNSCEVQDCNTTFGEFPGGHGVNNFSGFLISNAENVHITQCSLSARNAVFSARRGILFTAVKGLYITGGSFKDVSEIVIAPYEEADTPEFAYLAFGIEDLHIIGGLFEITSTSGGTPFYTSVAARFNHTNWNIVGAVLKGGTTAMRIVSASTGSYKNIQLDFTYTDSNVDDETHTTPVVWGGAVASGTIRAAWRPLAYSPSLLDGSVWRDAVGGQSREKSDGVWRIGAKTYRLVLENDSFTTVTPPKYADPGFMLVAGTGIGQNMMAWYRASASVASAKYFGGALSAIVDTPLTGTSGTAGNVTVGVQEDLIYVENRTGGTNTILITFL